VPELTGLGVSPGTGAGPVRRLGAAVREPPAGARHAGDGAAERHRARAALEAVAADLEARGARAGGTAQDILNAQALMAADPDLAAGVDRRIDAGLAAPRAVYEAAGGYRKLLIAAGGYLAGRAADLDDVRDRVIARLLGVPVPGVPESAEPFVLVARDLAPADTALLDPKIVVALVTEEGGPTSHTAILARAIGVPAVVACPAAAELADGTPVLVDGGRGAVLTEPTEEQLDKVRRAAAARARAESAPSGPGATADGHRVGLYANIGGPQDVAPALRYGAEGVGLFRTEFLFLDRAAPPAAAEQELAYRQVLEAFPGGTVIVRVLDAGSDKPLAFLPAPGEQPNPALGERGLRMLRRHPRILQTQLRALVAAAAGLPARLRVMAPMVADVDDAAAFTAACHSAGIEDAGVMVEVPSAALRAADLFAGGGAEFVSIGTNDLAQYAFAADRQVGAVARLQDPWQPALLDLVAAAGAAAREAGKDCGVCGEAAADPALACVLVGLGAASLSMSAPALPLVRAALAGHDLPQCRRAAAAARRETSAAGARAAVRAELPGLADLGV
jgi:phosphotransferase system enzyme I (PtsI)